MPLLVTCGECEGAASCAGEPHALVQHRLEVSLATPILALVLDLALALVCGMVRPDQQAYGSGEHVHHQ